MLDFTLHHPKYGNLIYEFSPTFLDAYYYAFIDSLFEEEQNVLWRGKLSECPPEFWRAEKLNLWKSHPAVQWAKKLGAGVLIKIAPDNPLYHDWK